MARLMKSFIGAVTGPLKSLGTESSEAPVVLDAPQVELSCAAESGEEEDEDSFEDYNCGVLPQTVPVLSKRGTLSKWTNYLHGWQERYFNVAEGIMSYFKSELDTNFGCRGSVSLQKATIACHEFDELRFDVRVYDSTYFLRAPSVLDKQQWIEVIEANKRHLQDMSTYDSSVALHRQGSILSLTSLQSGASVCSSKRADFQEKIGEIETFRNVLCRQLDTLQTYFDMQGDMSSQNQGDQKTGSNESIHDQEETEEGHKYRESVDSGLDFRPQGIHSSTSSDGTGDNPARQWMLGGDQTPPRGGTLPLRQSPIISSHKGHKRTGSDPFAFRNTYQRHHHSRPSLGGLTVSSGSPPPHLDFRREAATFKATTIGILTAMHQLIEMCSKREDFWQRKFDKEQEKRRKAERAAHAAMNGPKAMAFEYAGPDYEEGPHSVMNEEEFFDALEYAYKNEVEMIGRPQESTNSEPAAEENLVVEAASAGSDAIVPKSVTGVTHRLSEVVNAKVSQYAKYIFEPVDQHWAMVHEDGDMKVYRRELEENGVVLDPLKAQCTVKGLTAKEVCDFFFKEDTRLEWEGTLESVREVEKLAEDTLVFHQLHKRVWPSTQRESLFCSHLCTLPSAPRPENMVGQTWMVCNFSTDHDNVPPNSKLIRITLHVGMVCQTITDTPVEVGQEADLRRDNVSCRIIYAANVNPGGWAPPAAVRVIAKREITKFLKKFGTCVEKAVQNIPVTL